VSVPMSAMEHMVEADRGHPRKLPVKRMSLEVALLSLARLDLVAVTQLCFHFLLWRL
jgi:hypothetical protein